MQTCDLSACYSGFICYFSHLFQCSFDPSFCCTDMMYLNKMLWSIMHAKSMLHVLCPSFQLMDSHFRYSLTNRFISLLNENFVARFLSFGTLG